MSERLVRVTDFSELREGMIVVVKQCEACGAASCRAMLTERRVRYGCDSYAAVPSCTGRETALRAACVASGRLFRVLDGLEPTATTRAMKQRETTDGLR